MRGHGDSRTWRDDQGLWASPWGDLATGVRGREASRRELAEHVFTLALLSQVPILEASYASATRDRTLAWVRAEQRLAASAGIGATLVLAPLPAARRTLTGWTLAGRSRALLTEATDVLALLALQEDGTVGLFVLPLDQAHELRRITTGAVTQLDLTGVRVSPYDRIGSFDREGVEQLGRLAGRLRREIERAFALHS